MEWGLESGCRTVRSASRQPAARVGDAALLRRFGQQAFDEAFDLAAGGEEAAAAMTLTPPTIHERVKMRRPRRRSKNLHRKKRLHLNVA